MHFSPRIPSLGTFKCNGPIAETLYRVKISRYVIIQHTLGKRKYSSGLDERKS